MKKGFKGLLCILLVLSFMVSPFAGITAEAASYKFSLTGEIKAYYPEFTVHGKFDAYAKGTKKSDIQPKLKKNSKSEYTLTLYSGTDVAIFVNQSHTEIGGKDVDVCPIGSEKIDRTLQVIGGAHTIFVETKYQVGEWTAKEKQKKYTVYLQMGTGKVDKKKGKFVITKRFGNKIKLNIVVKRFETEAQKVYDKAYDFLMRGEKEYSEIDKAWICLCAVDDFYSYDVNGVCNEYSRGFEELAEAVGLEVYWHMNTGPLEPSDHAWNVVVIDGLAYPLDPTQSDLGSGLPPQRTYFSRHTYEYNKKVYNYKKAGDKKLKYGDKNATLDDFYTMENPDVKEFAERFFDKEQMNNTLEGLRFFDERMAFGDLYLDWLYFKFNGYSDMDALLKSEEDGMLRYLTKDLSRYGFSRLELGDNNKYRLTDEYIADYLEWGDY